MKFKISPFIITAFFLVPLLFLLTPLKFNLSSSPPISNLQSLISSPSPAFLPVSAQQPQPLISARNVFIIDRNSKTVLYQKFADTEVFPASTTKMMTALVALDHFSLDQKITVTQAYPIGQHIGFQPGEQVTVEQLLYALLVQSGNDAAEILAENFPGGRLAFINAMNTKADKLHLSHTHFVNPSGMDEIGHYSSATDLVRLADFVIQNSTISKIVATENAVIPSHILSNINQLLGKVPGVIGIKTGYTDGAGQSLVTLVDRDSHPVIIAVLGSSDRFADTKNLIDWVYSNFTWQDVSATADTRESQQAHTP